MRKRCAVCAALQTSASAPPFSCSLRTVSTAWPRALLRVTDDPILVVHDRGQWSRGAHARDEVIFTNPKDVDIAAWLDDATGLDRLRVLRSRAVNQLWDEKEIGVAHHQVDVFLDRDQPEMGGVLANVP